MRTDEEKRSTWRKHTPVPPFPAQMTHLTWDRTRTTAVGSRQLTAWAMAQATTWSLLDSELLTRLIACYKLFIIIIIIIIIIRSRDSSDDIATGSGLDYPGSIPEGVRFFSSPRRPDRLWDPSSLLSSGYRGSFPGGKAAEAWRWPLASI
jgi:hypothetical protein